MAIDTLLPNSVQFNSLIDRPLEIEPKIDALEMKLSPVYQSQTLVSGSTVELGNPLASRNRMVIKNTDSARTARIGGSGITEKIGYLLEPLSEVVITFDPSTAVSVYGRAVGAELSVEVLES